MKFRLIAVMLALNLAPLASAHAGDLGQCAQTLVEAQTGLVWQTSQVLAIPADYTHVRGRKLTRGQVFIQMQDGKPKTAWLISDGQLAHYDVSEDFGPDFHSQGTLVLPNAPIVGTVHFRISGRSSVSQTIFKSPREFKAVPEFTGSPQPTAFRSPSDDPTFMALLIRITTQGEEFVTADPRALTYKQLDSDQGAQLDQLQAGLKVSKYGLEHDPAIRNDSKTRDAAERWVAWLPKKIDGVTRQLEETRQARISRVASIRAGWQKVRSSCGYLLPQTTAAVVPSQTTSNAQ